MITRGSKKKQKVTTHATRAGSKKKQKVIPSVPVPVPVSLWAIGACIPKIFNYLPSRRDDDDDESRLNVLLASKVFRDVYKKQEGIDTQIIPTLVLRPSNGSTQNVIAKLSRILITPKKMRNLKKITNLVVENHFKFDRVHKIDHVYEIVQFNTCQLDNFLSLDMSKSIERIDGKETYNATTHTSSLTVLYTILQNLERLYISNLKFDKYIFRFSFPGFYRRNLKEIDMDNTYYCNSLYSSLGGYDVVLDEMDGKYHYHYDTRLKDMSDLHYHPDIFLFHECKTSLERLSIRNLRYTYVNGADVLIPQNALIKFVRKAPLLSWFRSDLTQKNMAMLQRERKNITFLN